MTLLRIKDRRRGVRDEAVWTPERRAAEAWVNEAKAEVRNALLKLRVARLRLRLVRGDH